MSLKDIPITPDIGLPIPETPKEADLYNSLKDKFYEVWNAIKRIEANQASGYTTFSNLNTDRTLDADATTVAELADVLGTLIEDLKTKGIIDA